MSHFYWHTEKTTIPRMICDDTRTLLPDEPYTHLISSGRIASLCNRWGNINIITTEGGFREITPSSPRSISAQYATIQVEGKYYSLHPTNADSLHIEYGTGYACYSGTFNLDSYRINYKLTAFTPPDDMPVVRFEHKLTFPKNMSSSVRITLRSDIFILPDFNSYLDTEHMGEIQICDQWAVLPAVDNKLVGMCVNVPVEYANEDFSILASTDINTNNEKDIILQSAIAFSELLKDKKSRESLQNNVIFSQSKRMWEDMVYNVVHGDDWQSSEARWAYGQLLSYKMFDESVSEHFLAIGGYGWERFSGREVAENLLLLQYTDHALTESCIRWLSKTQLTSGDIPKDHAYYHEEKQQIEFESDLEIWYLLGVCEYILNSGNYHLLEEQLSFWDGKEDTLYQHLKQAFQWIDTEIGYGEHGLIRMMDGDWNDYLSGIGRDHKGESVMNSGMAARAFTCFAQLAEHKLDTKAAHNSLKKADLLRKNVQQIFDGSWYPRGFSDEGEAVGSAADGHCFLNAQTWAILGGCGTSEQLERAAVAALKECESPYGLTLISKPYSFPPPAWLSRSPIPAGEGENAAIWPQTVHWFIWALTEIGMIKEAQDVWEKSSFQNYIKLFPSHPFGIFNGPDNYSSQYAGNRFGRTQVFCWNRKDTIPMQPSVAWQAFGLIKIRQVDKVNKNERK